jgi:hypothetical protein
MYLACLQIDVHFWLQAAVDDARQAKAPRRYSSSRPHDVAVASSERQDQDVYVDGEHTDDTDNDDGDEDDDTDEPRMGSGMASTDDASQDVAYSKRFPGECAPAK